MFRFLVSSRLPCLAIALFLPVAAFTQAIPSQQPSAPAPAAVTAGSSAQSSDAPQIPANAPHMSKQTRLEIIRDFETQLVYSRTAFPMGTKGLKLKDGTTTPNGEELRQALTLWGPAIKPGDPAHISYVHIQNDHIHFEINGGPVRRKKWYQHIEVSGSNGQPATPGTPLEAQNNPHGSFVDLYFDRYVPELSAAQVRNLLYPVLDFNARNKEQAYLDTVPPKAKEAILAHHVLVGMNAEMVIHAKGRPPKKVREKDGETDYEEWIYGEPPQDVDFVRIVGDEVVRVETMKVDGQKLVRTEKEVILEQPEKEAKQQEPEVRPANAPSLRRPGEDPQEAPKPAEGPAGSPLPPPTMPDPGSQPSGTGPGSMSSQGR
ncbi:MAG TPA: hypothetical protein VI386_16315 [Candidatus Sulfotelmatobacter sp.]